MLSVEVNTGVLAYVITNTQYSESLEGPERVRGTFLTELFDNFHMITVIVQHSLISNVTCYHGNLMLRKGSISIISSYLAAEAGLLWKCSNSFLIIMHLEEE